MHRTAAAIVLLAGAVCFPLEVSGAQAAVPPAKAAHVSPPVPPGLAPIDFAAMVERYGPAVVNISVAAPDEQTEPSAAAPGIDNLDPDDPLYALFRATSAPPPAPSTVPDAPRVVWGSGSGFIISPDGIVVTTAHIVNRSEQVTVTLTDRRRFKANVLGVDPQTDVALLQIEGANKLPLVRLGDASRVRVGERVLSIGSPDGPQNAAASGLVSVTPHALPDGSAFSFLQTDMATDPDTSGGPLLDRNGMAIGITVQVYGDSERHRNMTIAIPIEAALRLRMQLQGQGKVASGSLGVQSQDVDAGLAAVFGLPRAAGALVTSVTPAGRGAAASGLKAGDVITSINGKPIEHQAQLAEYVSALPPGSKVALAIVRNKKPMALTVVVSAGVENATPAKEATRATAVARGNAIERLGLSVHPLSDEERGSTGLPYGLMVESAAGAAERAGIRAGDVVLAVNTEAVSSRDQMEAMLERSGRSVALLIQRENARSFVSLNGK